MIDKAGLGIVGNDNFLLEALSKKRGQSFINDYVAWTINSSRCLGLKVINAGGSEFFKNGGEAESFSLDDIVPAYGVTSRQILKSLNIANEELKIPHPVHVHCNNLGMAGNIESILDNDFSLNGTGVHATVYGKGIYFTNRLEYACKFTTDNPQKKFILIAKVHVGDVVRGDPSLIRLPTMDSGKQYDTAVNDTNNPHIFVKFKNQHYTIVGCLEITLGEHSTLRVSRAVSRAGYRTNSSTSSSTSYSTISSYIGSHVTQPYTISSSHKTSQSLVDIHHNYTKYLDPT